MTAQFADTASRMTNQLDRASNQMTSHLEDASTRLFDNLEQSNTMMSERLDRTVAERLDKAGNTIFGQIDATARDLGQRLDLATNFLERVNGEISGNLETTSSGFSKVLDSASTTIIADLNRASAAFSDGLNEISMQVMGRIEQQTGLVAERLDQATRGLDSTAETTANQIAEHVDTVSGQIETASHNLTSRLVSQANQVAKDIGSAASLSANLVAERLGEAATDIENAGTSIANLLIERTAQTAASIDQGAKNAAGLVAGEVGRASSEIQSAMAKTAEIISGRAVEASEEIDKAARSASDLLSGRIDKAARDIETSASTSANILVGRVDKIAKDFESSAAGAAGAVIGRLEKTSRELDLATSSTGKELEDASEKFAKHVESANAFLASQLGTTASSLDDKLECVSLQLTGWLETTGARISERLEDVSGVIEKSNVDMDRILHNREDMLGSLVTSLGEKAQDVDGMMRNYMAVIEESLASAEARSKEVGRLMSSQYSVVADSFEQELRKLEQVSGGQVADAAYALRKQHDRTIATMNQMLAETATGFQQTARDMRITAQQVVKDVEFVRSELKRAILDLPDETRANVRAIRRVVVDQKTALNTLTDQTGSLGIPAPPQRFASLGGREDSSRQTEDAKFAFLKARTSGLTNPEEPPVKPIMARFGQPAGNGGSSPEIKHTAAAAANDSPARITAQQVVKDVEFVRSELKRAILDLPDDNIGAMRRVVAGKKTALNSLTDVMRRHFASLGREDSSRQTEDAKFAAIKPRRSGLTNPEEPPVKPIMARLDQPTGNGGSSSEIKRTAAAAAKDSPARSNILRETETLVHAAARDLVKVIEGILPTDLERRYTDGETGVYILNLHEYFGRRFESAVRQRYRDELLVRVRVESYLRRFERLLDTVSDAPSGDQLADSCLSSESASFISPWRKSLVGLNKV